MTCSFTMMCLDTFPVHWDFQRTSKGCSAVASNLEIFLIYSSIVFSCLFFFFCLFGTTPDEKVKLPVNSSVTVIFLTFPNSFLILLTDFSQLCLLRLITLTCFGYHIFSIQDLYLVLNNFIFIF